MENLVIGCNYHTKWQSHPGMRFKLVEIKGDKARLITRQSRKDFWTNVSDLIFITSDHNKIKAKRLSNENPPTKINRTSPPPKRCK